MPASSTRQLDRGVFLSRLSPWPPQLANRPASVMKVAWKRLEPGREEGGKQPGEEGNTELDRVSQPPVSRILVVLVMLPAIRTFSGLSHNFLLTFSGLSQAFLRNFSKLSKDFLWTFSGLSQDFLRTFSSLSQNCLRHSECGTNHCKHPAHFCVVGCKERGGPYLP